MDNRIMLSKLKYQKNSKQPKKSKRKLFTQPLNIPEQQDEQVAVNAKNYLIQLNKDEEGQYEQLIIKQKSELDISLSQWSNVSKNGYRLSERYPKSISIHVNKLDQRKISSKQFSSMEMSLIDKQATNNLYGMRNTNYSHFMKRKASVRTYASPQQQIKIKKFSSNIQTSQVNLPSNSRVLSFIVRQQKTTRIDCTPKIDISYTQKTNPQLKHSKHKQKIGQNRNKLPRLDHLQSQQHKNKYKSIFRVNNRKNIILVPMHSPISKDLSKIDDLIREESIKLLKKHF